MRFIFVDEAGTSTNEPITVVVGIILHADFHLILAETLLNECLGAVPLPLRDGFIVHATDVWNNPAYRVGWEITDRLNFLNSIMNIPRKLGMAIAIGLVRREAPEIEGFTKIGLSLEQQQHLMAFRGCLARADKYIRDYAAPTEVGTVVAEDIPEMRRFLADIPKKTRDITPVRSRNSLHATQKDIDLGYNTQQTEQRMTRIRQSIHFVKKDEDPMLQIADVCAFGIRRYFSKLQFGNEFAHALFGGHPNHADYEDVSSYGVFFWHLPKEQMGQQFTILT
jgi:hypothetical protein